MPAIAQQPRFLNQARIASDELYFSAHTKHFAQETLSEHNVNTTMTDTGGRGWHDRLCNDLCTSKGCERSGFFAQAPDNYQLCPSL